MRFVRKLPVCLMLCLNVSAFGGGASQHPAQRRSGQGVHFPANQSFVRFPFEFLANAVFIPVRVNGKGPYLFYVDTGASDAIIASEEASRLGVHLSPSAPAWALGRFLRYGKRCGHRGIRSAR
jgi:hypothetical protein